MYGVEQQWISKNRSYVPLYPVGLVIHSTDTKRATAQNEHDYLNSAYRGSSAHEFVDWFTIIQTAPLNEQAWHAYPYANSHFLSLEMCESDDPAQFAIVYAQTVWRAALLCQLYRWVPAESIHSHDWVSKNYQGDHTDPLGYLARNGKTWDMLVSDISAKLLSMSPPVTAVDMLRVVANADAVNIRSAPSLTSTVRYVVKRGQLLHLSQLQGEWAFTTYGALGGWINRNYLALPPATP